MDTLLSSAWTWRMLIHLLPPEPCTARCEQGATVPRHLLGQPNGAAPGRTGLLPRPPQALDVWADRGSRPTRTAATTAATKAPPCSLLFGLRTANSSWADVDQGRRIALTNH